MKTRHIGKMATRLRAARLLARRSFHLGTDAYHSAFSPAIAVDTDEIRAAAVAALDAHDSGTWFTSPMVSLLGGERLADGASVDTRDAFGAINGAQLLATEDEAERLVAHAAYFRPPPADLRAAVRRAEERMLTVHAGALVANQTLDFGKQDGITEIEEALQANAVERRLNDQLWEAEASGALTIPRRVALIPCVSNFSHFLDMCRKGLRLLELGVPVMVLSRTHTQQYPYRWAAILADELAAQGVDPRYFSFCSAALPVQQRLMAAADKADKAGALTAAAAARGETGVRVITAADAYADLAPTPTLFTGARALAADIKATSAAGLIASTQGPNLMLALGLPPAVANAAAMSATIEHSGQCTALRVLVAPPEEATAAAVQAMFDGTPKGGVAKSYLAEGTFAGILEPPPRPGAFTYIPPEGYTAHPTQRVAFKVRGTLPDAAGAPADEPPLDEFWRQVVLDVVAPDAPLTSEAALDAVGAWLVKHQPISLAINGTSSDADHAAATAAIQSAIASCREPAAAVLADEASALAHLAVARALFERSALCVYSVGDADVPALTAQARPQDGEIFGELPPLESMVDVTTFPVLGPSPTAASFASYSRAALRERSVDEGAHPAAAALASAAASAEVAGYVLELGSYLQAAAGGGPRRCVGARTGLYGLQRPPLDGRLTALRCGAAAALDDVLPFLLPFAMTNAAAQSIVSVDPANAALRTALESLLCSDPSLGGLALAAHTDAELASAEVQATLCRTLEPSALAAAHRFPLAQQFVTRMMPAGHIKSSRSDDAPFLATMEASEKWLRVE